MSTKFRRLAKEIAALPVLALVMLYTPFIVLGILLNNRDLRRNNKKIIEYLEKEPLLLPLTRYAREKHGIRFTFHGSHVKKGVVLWFVQDPRRMGKATTILEGYGNWLKRHNESWKGPVIYLQFDWKHKSIMPYSLPEQLRFLSHEIAHLENWGKDRDICLAGKKGQECAKREVWADLEGLAILRRLGYDPRILRQVLGTNEILGELLRCKKCLKDSRCWKELEQFGFTFHARGIGKIPLVNIDFQKLDSCFSS